ncbi:MULTISPECIES: ABC transporter ATP-binding protein [Mesorhizobium]|uniref:ABC transporter ATP-binding protein n=1 Tax=Mesorhizobium wenxiniae TaxID=2014805 RepID=A0A271KIV8_9HYPH|nr:MULTISPECIES: ABC transporter ATP-binding protein [Mesorhizobium]PAP95057.1 ABC transporter ATP-binding protein [Mesorhizobium wenxiniae]RUV60759.1 ABC transporter ATP-binding protein [Mesorhizobium sp. M5C.F.Ca.IN.020.29.1.1]RWC44998.1 MAG: ABC transporter ATP-binding protein [Mesorhizobium sp.]TIM91029.1 MAG: ABC transporter ATP-binding protein [Mesorhizobium sp.]TIR30904.1 MAG: ABC transporter ATP-binding protein [Mesorhizobium sp.]
MAEIRSNAASVEFRNVTKIYGKSKAPAVNGVSLFIEAGKLVTLLGPSGCGKTTTLRMIAGLEMVTGGQILIGGADVTRLPATDRDVSMVFQSYALFPHMTVTQNVEYGLGFSGFGRKETAERARAGLELVGLSNFGDRLPSQLSGGQQQRVAVARALVLEPQVLLFDEPLSNLDAKLRRRVREEIREIQQKLGLTVVYVTHDQEEALAVSDRIIVMNNAVIAQDGTPRELYEQPANAFVADFIGEANMFQCEVVSVEGDSATVQLGSAVLKLPARGRKPGPAKLAARPSRLEIGEPNAPGTLPGTLEKVTYVGSHLEFVVATQFGEVFVISPDVDTAFRAGQPVSIGFPERGPVLITD